MLCGGAKHPHTLFKYNCYNLTRYLKTKYEQTKVEQIKIFYLSLAITLKRIVKPKTLDATN